MRSSFKRHKTVPPSFLASAQSRPRSSPSVSPNQPTRRRWTWTSRVPLLYRPRPSSAPQRCLSSLARRVLRPGVEPPRRTSILLPSPRRRDPLRLLTDPPLHQTLREPGRLRRRNMFFRRDHPGRTQAGLLPLPLFHPRGPPREEHRA
jgi:hypothetical protein